MRRLVVSLTLGSLALVGLGACGSDTKSSTTEAGGSTTTSPESVIVDDATVTAGFTKLPSTIAAAIAAIGTPDAKAKLDQIEAEWFSFEGAVREKDSKLYLAIEDQLTPLQRQIEAGDSATATTTAATLAGLFTEYLTKYPGVMRRVLMLLAGVLGALAMLTLLPAAPASASGRDDAIEQVQKVRLSIDATLSLIKQGKAEEAYAAAADGYLSHFELVEIPLRVIDNDLTIDAEGRFADIRQLIRDHAPVDEIRDKLIELRGVLDTIERKLTATGAAAPALIFGQSFLIIFREGFEVVLLVSVLLGYLEAARSTAFIKPILIGIGLAGIATILTVFLLRVVFQQLPFSLEVLEGITALIAVAMLFYVSFWLVARMEHKRWMEFIRARLWSAVSLGSTVSLVLVGFTSVYREGFETALFYQALLSFGAGLGVWVVSGLVAGLAALTVVALFMFRLGRRVPVKKFMSIAVVCVMITSVTFLGNAVHALQAGDLIAYHRLDSWPRLPIFLSQATGYWPTVQSVVAQIVLSLIYLLGALYAFVIKPRRHRRTAELPPSTLAAA